MSVPRKYPSNRKSGGWGSNLRKIHDEMKHLKHCINGIMKTIEAIRIQIKSSSHRDDESSFRTSHASLKVRQGFPSEKFVFVDVNLGTEASQELRAFQNPQSLS